MPFPVLDHVGSFRVFVFLVFRGLFVVEKTHEWTVGNERYNPVSLVVIVFQTSDPHENDEDGHTDQFYA